MLSANMAAILSVPQSDQYRSMCHLVLCYTTMGVSKKLELQNYFVRSKYQNSEKTVIKYGFMVRINSLAPGRCGSDFKKYNHRTNVMSTARHHFVNAPSQWEMRLQCNVVSHWLGVFTKSSLHFLWKWMPQNTLIISQHWFRYWFGAISYQAITWANVDPDMYHNLVSLGHNELVIIKRIGVNNGLVLEKATTKTGVMETNYDQKNTNYLCCVIERRRVTLKQKDCYFDKFVINGCTGSCHFDNFQCSQWWQICQHSYI